jgi:hypothetical protein
MELSKKGGRLHEVSALSFSEFLIQRLLKLDQNLEGLDNKGGNVNKATFVTTVRGWKRPFEDPIPLPSRTRTLEDAADYTL